MRILQILLALTILISSISTFEQPNLNTFLSDLNEKFQGMLEEGKQAVNKVNDRIQDFARSGQMMLDETLPNNNDIAKFFKQTVTGTPFEITMNVFHTFCSANLHATLKERIAPEITKFKLVLMTSCKNYSYSITDAGSMWSNKVFDPAKKTVVLVTGWMSDFDNVQDPMIDAISKAYMCRGDVNFVALDTANYLDTFYDWAALNAEEIGKYLGKALSLLTDKVHSKNIHLIGHSLGAHIVSAAGRTYFTLTDKLIGRITGLDPAQPCFNEGEQLNGISRGDAEYVDIIHSNPGILGKKEAVGDADFYPNGFDSIPNGCFTIACAHSRAWQYYAESVYPGNENNFLAAKCSSMKKFQLHRCTAINVPMGYADKRQNVKGIYFLETSEFSPYGLNATTNALPEKCGLCEE